MYIYAHVYACLCRKQAKALQLLLNLAESELNETNCTDFFHILKDFFVAEDRRLQSSDDATAVQALSPPTATIVDKLISLYFTRSNLFCNIQRFQLQNWFLVYSVKNSLCCDDSFRFSRACQVVSDLFDCDAMFPPLVIADYSIDNSESSSDDFRKEDGGDEQEEDKEGRPGVALRKARTNATLACMTATLPLYSRSLWAKQPLDKLFAAVAQRRLLLPPDQREQLDDLTTKITTMRRKAVSGKPDQTVRAFNSTAHPLKTKKVGLLR